MDADQITAWALVLTAIGTITTPAVVAFFAQRGLKATEEVKKEVVTGNEQTLGQLGTRAETMRVQEISPDNRTAQEQRHVDADPLSKEE